MTKKFNIVVTHVVRKTFHVCTENWQEAVEETSRLSDHQGLKTVGGFQVLDEHHRPVDTWALEQATIAVPGCHRCDTPMTRSKVITQTFTGGTPDFPSDQHSTTFSAGGPGALVDCWKCPKCGRSIKL